VSEQPVVMFDQLGECLAAVVFAVRGHQLHMHAIKRVRA
jgi:hypothetical protein